VKYLTLLALLPFFALTAQAHEDASLLPWDEFTRDTAVPTAAVKLLVTVRLGTHPDTFRVPLSNCGNDVQAVKLVVQNADVTVQTFGLKFTDGTSRDFNVNRTFRAGTDSGWIDLGLFRAMDSRCPVDVYAKASATGPATVLVYGNLK
jgi:hypothetical protein